MAKKKQTEPKEECPACGNPEPKRLRPCPFCDTLKCEVCDMGDDVGCASCENEEDEPEPYWGDDE